MTGPVGSFVVRRARLVLVAAMLAVVGFGVLGVGAFGELQTGGFQDPGAESTIAQTLTDQRFGGSDGVVLLVHAEAGTVDGASARAAGAEAARRLAAVPGVSNVVSYWQTRDPGLRSKDGRYALILGSAKSDRDLSSSELASLRSRSRQVDVTVGGSAAIGNDITKQVGKSLAIAEAIAVPLTLVLLVFAFGSVVSAALPLAIGGVAILGTFAELFVLGSVTDVSIFAINLTTALGLGLGIDYALFMVSRFREQLAKGDPVPEAVAATRRDRRAYGDLHRGGGDGRAERAAGLPAVLPALVRLRRDRRGGHRRARCAGAAARPAVGAGPPGQRGPGAAGPGRPTPPPPRGGDGWPAG